MAESANQDVVHAVHPVDWDDVARPPCRVHQIMDSSRTLAPSLALL
jgi:hypothetical protein